MLPVGTILNRDVADALYELRPDEENFGGDAPLVVELVVVLAVMASDDMEELLESNEEAWA